MDPGPVFPAELIDLIIDKSWEIKNDPDRAQSLSSLAFLSRSSWIRVNKLRFQTVDLHGTFQKPADRRVRAFCDLIEADPQSETIGLASYVRSFKLQICAKMIRRKFPVMEARFLYDGTLLRILKKLFKTHSFHEGIDTEKTPTKECSLAVKLSYKQNADDYEHYLSWLASPPDLRDVLSQCLRNPSVTTLHIKHLEGFPIVILRHSFIRHFTIDAKSVSFHNDHNKGPQTHLLESINTGPNFPFPKLVELLPYMPCSRLRKLSIFIVSPHESTLAMMTIAESPFLEVLTIKYRSLNGQLNGPLDLQLRSLKLQELNIHYDRGNQSFKTTSNYALHHMHNTINPHSLPPNLKSLGITFSLYNDANWLRPGDVFSAIDFRALDEFFSDPLFHSLTSLTFGFKFLIINPSNQRFDMELFLTDAKTWLCDRKSFLLSARRDSLMEPDIMICPQIVQGSWRRSSEWYLL